MKSAFARIQVTRLMRLACLVMWPALCNSYSWGQEAKHRLTLREIGPLAAETLAQRDGYQNGDLITQSDVKLVMKTLASFGWVPKDQKELINLTLPDDDPLKQILSTVDGTRFMRQSGGAVLIYDRMDRVCRVFGGERMLVAMARLPDGHRYAELKRPYGVPGFLDLLPKTGSGRRRSIKDYDQPTGRIYTEQQLITRLEETFQSQLKAAAPTN